jgi:hypothetical protein
MHIPNLFKHRSCSSPGEGVQREKKEIEEGIQLATAAVVPGPAAWL